MNSSDLAQKTQLNRFEKYKQTFHLILILSRHSNKIAYGSLFFPTSFGLESCAYIHIWFSASLQAYSVLLINFIITIERHLLFYFVTLLLSDYSLEVNISMDCVQLPCLFWLISKCSSPAYFVSNIFEFVSSSTAVMLFNFCIWENTIFDFHIIATIPYQTVFIMHRRCIRFLV